MAQHQPIVTLTTDFGYGDHYVAAMKAVMLGIRPELNLVDISHAIPPQDIMAGAWVLKNSAFLFPKGSIHLAVIDPGVGTARKPIILEVNGQIFVGPDNGLFSLLAADQSYKAYEVQNKAYMRPDPSHTFHGRDIFAPVSAHLASGVSVSKIGKPVDSIETYRWATPISDDEGIQGWVIHIDHYGNLITNIPREMLDRHMDKSLKIYAGTSILKKISSTFADVAEGEPAAVFGSSGMLEIVINKGCARELLNIHKGAPVSVVFQKEA